MSVFIKGGRAAKFLSKHKYKALVPAALVGGGAAVGAAVSYSNALPGLKHQALREGAAEGALIGSALFLAPKIAKHAGKKAAKSASRGMRKGKVIFRRFRGRLIPIRVKK